MFAAVFILLYVAHLAADYPLQTDHQAAHKADRSAEGWRANVVHAGTHAAACTAALLAGAAFLPEVALPVVRTVIAVAWIGVTHSVVDRRWPVVWWMDHTRQRAFRERGGAAHVDQTAHVLALAVAALVIAA